MCGPGAEIFEFEDEYMDKNKLTKEQIIKLEKLMKEMTSEAKKVRGDYEKNPPPPEMSGSVHYVHQDSPILMGKKERLITFKSQKNVDKKK